jgi:preprotein translocase subunit SecE
MAEEKNVAPAEAKNLKSENENKKGDKNVAAEPKNAKPKKEKQKGKVKNAWKGFKSEVKKVVWPSWKQVLKGSGVVLVVVSICAIAIGALDFAFQEGITAIVKLFS